VQCACTAAAAAAGIPGQSQSQQLTKASYSAKAGQHVAGQRQMVPGNTLPWCKRGLTVTDSATVRAAVFTQRQRRAV